MAKEKKINGKAIKLFNFDSKAKDEICVMNKDNGIWKLKYQ